jgi:hypothetical protein
MRARLPIAVVVAGILGGLALAFVFPWADPCDVVTHATHGCNSELGSWHGRLWNLLFLVILATTGCVSGLIAPHARYIGGIASAIAASVIAHFGVHAMYGLDYEGVNWRLPGMVVAAGISVAIVGASGALGGLLSRSIGRASI